MHVEATAIVQHRQMNSLGRSFQENTAVCSFAVFDRVAQRLLRDPENAERDVGRQRRRKPLLVKINAQVSRIELLAQTLDRSRQAEMIEFRGVQPVRQPVYVR